MKYMLNSFAPILLLLFSLICLSGCGDGGGSNIVTIGVLTSDTGDSASIGPTIREGLQLAEKEVNKLLSSEGAKLRLKLQFEDTASSPTQALTKLQALEQDGISIVIGPIGSSEAAALRDYSRDHGIVLLSPASTASSLALSDDLIIRTTANDLGQAAAITAALNYFRTRFYVPIWRADEYGDSLTFDIGNSFSHAGGSFAPGSRYPEGTTDFTDALHQLEVQVDAYRGSFGLNSAAVYVVSFDEIWDILTQARSFSVLNQVRWYGSDGVALNPVALTRPEVTEFLRKVDLLSPIYAGDPTSSEFIRVRALIEEKLGYKVQPYALTAYDAVLLVARTLQQEGSSALVGEALRDAIIARSNEVTGVTGPLALDANGDRSIGVYEFWKVVQNGEGLDEWQLAGSYSSSSGFVPK